jgi:hypothetical protein
MPGAGYPTHTTAIRDVSRVRSPPGATRTAVKGHPSRLLVAILLWIVAAAVSEQNRLLSSSRSRSKKPFSIWWSMERVLALLVIGHRATPELCFIGAEEWRRKSCDRPYLDERSRLDHRNCSLGLIPAAYLNMNGAQLMAFVDLWTGCMDPVHRLGRPILWTFL